MEPTPEQRHIIWHMFIATADKNYMLARYAFFNQLYDDFYWLSVHAIEKYMKATLLFNGFGVKNKGHDIEGLMRSIRSKLPMIEYGELAKPDGCLKVWRSLTFGDFLARLNRMGDPANRYATYGFNIMFDDLLKLDQTIWTIRRHARKLKWEQKRGFNETLEVDEVRRLRENPTEWKLGNGAPLEKLLEAPEKPLHHWFVLMNTPFAPEVQHDLRYPMVAMTNSPLGKWLSCLGNEEESPGRRETGAQVARWALACLKLGREDEKHIRSLLQQYERSSD